jgi:hypothetical protein
LEISVYDAIPVFAWGADINEKFPSGKLTSEGKDSNLVQPQ